MNALRLLWIDPLAGGVGMFTIAIFAGSRDIPPLCEDCPRVEQPGPEIVRCKGCTWFAPLESMPHAEELHSQIIDALGDILPRRAGEVGVCRKVTFCKDKPVLTHEGGYCHRAEPKENQ